MTDHLRDRLAAELAVCEASTPGPWENDGGGEVGQHWSLPEPWKPVVSTQIACASYCYGGSADGVIEEADAEFIARARTGYPLALRALQAVVELCDMLSTPTMHDSDRQVGRIEGLREVRRLIEGVYGDE